MTAAQRLRAILQGGSLAHAPGVTDPLTALLAVDEGFPVVYLSGAVTSAVALGLPDLGFLHGSDVAAHAGRISPLLRGIPLIADADTGYGNAVHVRRTVAQYAAAGVAGLHVEDQVSPKRCGHMTGKAAVGRGEAAAKVRAAVEASRELGASGPVVVARTDVLSLQGMDEACSRAAAFAEAGADAVMVEGVRTPEQAAAVRDAGAPVQVLNRSEAGGPVGATDDSALAAAGVRLVIHPVSALLAAADAVRAAYRAIRADGSAARVQRMDWYALSEVLALPDLLELERRYAADDPEEVLR